MFVDLHMHSCLSPCADDDMTPANICGMAHIKGLQAIAVTDHNTARNLPYVKEAADYYGLILLPGMEITTKEEVHLLGYFRDVETAVKVGEIFTEHLPKMKNRPDYFGNQYVMNTDDEIVETEERLLIGSTDLDLGECTRIILEHGGDIYAMTGDTAKAVELWTLALQYTDERRAMIEEKLKKKKYVKL
jgi:DNA polymerase III alpha subunit